MGTMPKPRLSSAAALVGATGLLLVSCADDETQNDAASAQPEASQSSDAKPSPTSEDAGVRLVDVDPSTFEIGRSHVFRYVLDGESGECTISERGAMCMGSPGNDIPEVKVDPFPQGPASAVSVGVDGTEYLVFEGAPPAPATLKAGERISIGQSSCSVNDASTLTCDFDGESFTLEGAEAVISTSAEPVGRYFIDGSSDSGETSGNAGATKNAGESCGTASSAEFSGFDGRDVEVRQGPVDCDEAMKVLGEYLETPTDADHGNANIRQYGDWNCAMPTYGSAQQSGFSLSCSGPDGESIGIRN